jgi:hypothetical protein
MANVKRIIVSAAIAIVFAFFVGYFISAFYAEPRYEVYCNESISNPNVMYNSSDSCEQAGGKWNPPYIYEYKSPAPTEAQGYCDLTYYCSQKLQKDSEIYNRNVFFITSLIGIITIIVSFFLTLEFVSNGFLTGAIFLIIYGTIRYWGFMSDKIKAIMLGLTLVLLVWIAYKKLNKENKKRK